MNSPLFGITLSLLVYVIMQKIQIKTKISILNPLLFSGIVVIVTGIFGAAISPFLNKLFKIKNTLAKGLALGSSAHAVGTSKAIENSEEEGAFSSIALILTGLMTVLSAPLVAYIITLIIK